MEVITPTKVKLERYRTWIVKYVIACGCLRKTNLTFVHLTLDFGFLSRHLIKERFGTGPQKTKRLATDSELERRTPRERYTIYQLGSCSNSVAMVLFSDRALRFKEMAMKASPVLHQLLLVFVFSLMDLVSISRRLKKRSVEMLKRPLHPLVLLQPIDRIFDTNVRFPCQD